MKDTVRLGCTDCHGGNSVDDVNIEGHNGFIAVGQDPTLGENLCEVGIQYDDDFIALIPDYLDVIDSAWEGWPGIRDPGAKDYLIKHQITAEGWFVANPELSLAEINRMKRIDTALNKFLDEIA